jgi:hypothetical protein
VNARVYDGGEMVVNDRGMSLWRVAPVVPIGAAAGNDRSRDAGRGASRTQRLLVAARRRLGQPVLPVSPVAFGPNGAHVSSQGWKPLVRRPHRRASPAGAKVGDGAHKTVAPLGLGN